MEFNTEPIYHGPNTIGHTSILTHLKDATPRYKLQGIYQSVQDMDQHGHFGLGCVSRKQFNHPELTFERSEVSNVVLLIKPIELIEMTNAIVARCQVLSLEHVSTFLLSFTIKEINEVRYQHEVTGSNPFIVVGL